MICRVDVAINRDKIQWVVTAMAERSTLYRTWCVCAGKGRREVLAPLRSGPHGMRVFSARPLP